MILINPTFLVGAKGSVFESAVIEIKLASKNVPNCKTVARQEVLIKWDMRTPKLGAGYLPGYFFVGIQLSHQFQHRCPQQTL